MRAAIHYFLAFVLLSIYGGQVCPFLESLTFTTLASVIFSWLLSSYLARIALIKNLIDPSAHYLQPKRLFILELSVFIAAGFGMAIFNMFYFSFPFGSGIKLTLGCSVLGLFAAADLALKRERALAEKLAQDNQADLKAGRFFPVTKKLIYLGTALTISTAAIIALVILHDLSWITQLSPDTPLGTAARSIIIEIAFVMGILLLYTQHIIISYSRNLKLYFKRQTIVLDSVAKGDLQGHVPITTNDEFALIGRYTNNMITELRERAEALARTQSATIRALASLAETRDNETGQHIIRTQHYVGILADELKDHEKYRKFLCQDNIQLLFESAPLHDAGKVGVPDKILLKPGKLTDVEFEEMKKHTIYGRDALMVAEATLGKNSFLRLSSEIAYTHHEKWDGSGYPENLKGESIPVSGRLMALADVYDALISKRIYKPAFPHEKAYAIILEGRGNHFDPDVVDAFVRRENDFKKIASEHADSSA